VASLTNSVFVSSTSAPCYCFPSSSPLPRAADSRWPVSGTHEWIICLVIIGVATLGKLGGSAVAAKMTSLSWRESIQLGALMNTRGLMELIALNIGYDLGILSQRIFTMLVIMALVTTIMTAPLLTLFSRRRATSPAGLAATATF